MSPGCTLATTRALLFATALAAPISFSAGVAHAQGEAPAAEAEQRYRGHMENGVKLFQDQNYEAAIAEFNAAYQASPRANPLINIALAHKARFRYPKAIAALERALGEHADSMQDADKKAARDAIDEMSKLLAFVEIQVKPKGAVVSIDGDEVEAKALEGPIPLGPGKHRIRATMPGYAPDETEISVVSGERVGAKLELRANQGYLRVVGDSSDTTIFVDGSPMGVREWAGLLDPGTHTVVLRTKDMPDYAVDVDLVAGKAHEIRRGVGGRPVGPRTLPDVPPPPEPKTPEPEIPPPSKGVYALVYGGLLFPVTHPIKSSETDSGGAFGVRLGYRVNTVAAFDFSVEYSDVAIDASNESLGSYSTAAWRLGPTLRLMTPTRIFRPYLTLGGGLAHVDVEMELEPVGYACLNAPPADAITGNPSYQRPSECQSASGFDPYLLLEAGFELDFDGVLVGAAFETIMQSTKGIDTDDVDRSPYDDDPLVQMGPSLRVGYAFW